MTINKTLIIGTSYFYKAEIAPLLYILTHKKALPKQSFQLVEKVR